MKEVKTDKSAILDPNAIYIDDQWTIDDEDLDGELHKGVLLAQDQEHNTYVLQRDQAAGDDAGDDVENEALESNMDGLALTWYRPGACETYDDGRPFIDRISAIRWAMRRGWWVWHAKDGEEAQKWIGEQLRKQREKQPAGEIGGEG